jgi:uncharacterized protein with gpF-like domain
MNRRDYSKTSERQYKRFERMYLRKVFNALKSQVTPVVNALHSRGHNAAIKAVYAEVINQQVLPTLQDLHTDIGLFFARKSYREIRKSAKEGKNWINEILYKQGMGLNEKWTRDIIEYFSRELFVTVSSITETTREQILSVLQQGLSEGWSIDQIASELQSPELLLWRARLIARTELVKGAFVGTKIASEDSEWETEKEWIAANDHRTRHSHRNVDGVVIDSDDKFKVAKSKGGNDLMDGPGDPTASVENIANCRCSLAVLAKRDAQGKLIPKRNITIISPAAVKPPRELTL